MEPAAGHAGDAQVLPGGRRPGTVHQEPRAPARRRTIAIPTARTATSPRSAGFGFRQQAGNIPYWKNYMWPTREAGTSTRAGPSAGTARRMHWRPLLHGADVACDVRNAKFENGRLMPPSSTTLRSVVPHPVAVPGEWLYVDYDVVGAGDDYWSLRSAATTGGLVAARPRVHGPHWGIAERSGGLEDRRTERCGLKEFWLRIDMASHTANPTLALQALQIGVGFRTICTSSRGWCRARTSSGSRPPSWQRQQAAGRVDLPGR